jgi:hypothetical protein
MSEKEQQQQNEQERARAQAQAQAQERLRAQAKSQVVSNTSQQAQVQNQPNANPSSEQGIIQQNIEGDQQAHKNNEALSLLKRIVGLASPVVENREETVEQKDADGNVNNVPVTKKVTTGYSYYAVNGKPFEEWVEETFGGDITVNTEDNTIKYNKPIEEIVAKDIQPVEKKEGEEPAKKGVRT